MAFGVFPPQPVFLGPKASLMDVFRANAQANPVLLYSLIIFILAIIHTLIAYQITKYANYLVERNAKKYPVGQYEHSFKIEILHFLGEVEVIFAIWVIPLLIVITIFYDWHVALGYLNSVRFNEPLFVVVIMIIASTKPILKFAEWCLHLLAKIFGGGPIAWWLIILTVCPILGSFITEPGAMTLGALLLKRQIYEKQPSKTLAYATLGLLFVNISIGGVLTNFAAPPVLMVAEKWCWTNGYMFRYFGLKSIASIILSNFVYLIFFYKQLKSLKKTVNSEQGGGVPVWITSVHILFLIGTIFFLHYQILLIGLLLLFIAFQKATAPHQDQLSLRGPLLVGTFLAGLVVHGTFQGWWIEPVINGLSPTPLLLVTTILTGFNDNALITYLSGLIPNLSPILKYMVMSGAVAGGGLTIIANAPNPAGQFLLREYFEDGVAPLNLFIAALFPTALIVLLSWLVIKFMGYFSGLSLI